MKQKTLAYFILAISIILGFCTVFIGLDFADTFFWLCSFQADAKPDPLNIATQRIGQGLLPILGLSVLSWRIAVWVIKMITLLIPYFVLLDRRQRENSLIPLALTILLLSSGNIPNSDVLTALICVAEAVLFIKWRTKSSWDYGKIMVVALLSTWAIFVRFPNFALVLVNMILLIYMFCTNSAYTRKSSLLILGVYLSAVVAFYLGLSSVYHVDSMKEGFSAILSSNADESTYTTSRLLLAYGKGLLDILIVAGLVFAQMYLDNHKTQTRNYHLGSIFVFAILLLICLAIGAIWGKMGLFKELMIGCMVAFLIYGFISKQTSFYAAMIMVAFSLVLPFGSDTGLTKAYWIIVAFLPYLVISSGFHLRTIYAKLIVAIVFLCMLWMGCKGFEDKRIYRLTATVNVDNIRGVLTNPTRKQVVEDIDNEVQDLIREGSEFVFFGRDSYLFNHLYQKKMVMPNYLDFYQSVDGKSNIEMLSQLCAEKQPVVFVVPTYPEYYSCGSVSGSLLDIQLQTQNYTPLEKLGYIVYYPNVSAK